MVCAVCVCVFGLTCLLLLLQTQRTLNGSTAGSIYVSFLWQPRIVTRQLTSVVWALPDN